MTISSVNLRREKRHSHQVCGIRTELVPVTSTELRCSSLCRFVFTYGLSNSSFLVFHVYGDRHNHTIFSLSVSLSFVHHDCLRSLNVIVLFFLFFFFFSLSLRFSFRCSLRLLLNNIADKRNRVSTQRRILQVRKLRKRASDESVSLTNEEISMNNRELAVHSRPAIKSRQERH